MLKKLILIIAVLGLVLITPKVSYAQQELKMTITAVGTLKTAIDAINVIPSKNVPTTKEITVALKEGGLSCPLPSDWTGACQVWQTAIKPELKKSGEKWQLVMPTGPIDLDSAYITYDNMEPKHWGSVLSVKIEIVNAAVGFNLPNPLQADSFQELVENIIKFVWTISLAVVPLMIIVAGFLFLSAGGRPAQITLAKRMLFWTILGFVVIFFARGIIGFINKILGG